MSKKYLTLFLVLFYAFSIKGQVISTFAGNGMNSNTGDGGLAINAGIYAISGSVFDNDDNLYIVSGLGHKIRKIDINNNINTVAGTGTGGYNGDGGISDTSLIKQPMGITVDSLGNIFFADAANHRVRRIDKTTNIITTIAGTGIQGFSGDGAFAINAQLNTPNSVCFDKLGNLYICDAYNYRIRKITSSGIITTVVGTGNPGNSGDGNLAISAEINLPVSVVIDEINNLYIADYSGASNCIRKVDVSTGIISTYAGTGNAVYNGDNILAISANISPIAIAFDLQGNLFVCDRYNSRVRKIDKQSGIMSTVVGNGTTAYSGDGGQAILAQLNGVVGIVFDTCGNLYIHETNQGRIRKVDFNPNCWPVSVQETKAVTLNIYPNPSNSAITISGDHLQNISITNTLGQIVHWQKASAEKTVVDISALNAGIYFVTVTDVQGAKLTKKVVKE